MRRHVDNRSHVFYFFFTLTSVFSDSGPHVFYFSRGLFCFYQDFQLLLVGPSLTSFATPRVSFYFQIVLRHRDASSSDDTSSVTHLIDAHLHRR